MPFAVAGSTEVHDVDGKKVRGRKYPWGLVEGNLINIQSEQFKI